MDRSAASSVGGADESAAGRDRMIDDRLVADLGFLRVRHLAVVASGLRVYPFGGSRVTLYLLPPLFLLAGAGAQPYGARGNRWLVRLWWMLPAR